MKTLKLRIKDKHSSVLLAMSREVNTVWNYCNETSSKAIADKHKWLSGFDLDKLTAGYTKEDGVKIGSTTVQEITSEYATRRRQFKKRRLNWRVSNPKSSKYSLGWVPFKGAAIKYKAGQIKFAGISFGLWDSYGLSRFELRSGSFSQDCRGRWYINICVDDKEFVGAHTPKPSVGIDLGLKTAVTCSNGQALEGRTYRRHEPALAIAQRARKKNRVRAIHAKIANTRKDAMHKLSSSIVKRHSTVFVGNVSSSKIIKTKMAKSAHDAGWSMFKTMLVYKCRQAGIVYREVNESYTTQTCSSCGVIPSSSPKGLAGLNKRVWDCNCCGAKHDRDLNAAINIRERGHALLAVGIPVL